MQPNAHDGPDHLLGGPTVGWSSRRRRRLADRTRRFLALAFAIPLALSLIAAPASAPGVQGDELSDAKAKQAQLKKDIGAQKARVAQLNDLQAGLADEIRSTKQDLREVGADLEAVRKKITTTEQRIIEVKAVYDDLVRQLEAMDAELKVLEAQEVVKRQELSERRALLAERIRNAYDTDRTSPLETFLSGGTFTDLLAEMSYYIDVGEQDEALATQITKDKETLAALHTTVEAAREGTNLLRQETAAQKRALDRALAELEETRKELRRFEKQVARTLKEQQARYAALKRSKANAAAIIRKAAAEQKALARRIDKLIERQVNRGNIPSKFNGTLRWPMDSFTVSGNFGCSAFEGYAPGNGCENFHNGIDMVAGYGKPIKAAASGTVVFVGWNWADGPDPAWVVVVAHSGNLRTWYAHMQPKRPVAVGDRVAKGQVIGYEGNTGRSTGSHLHWGVELNGQWVNPRLFL